MHPQSSVSYSLPLGSTTLNIRLMTILRGSSVEIFDSKMTRYIFSRTSMTPSEAWKLTKLCNPLFSFVSFRFPRQILQSTILSAHTEIFVFSIWIIKVTEWTIFLTKFRVNIYWSEHYLTIKVTSLWFGFWMKPEVHGKWPEVKM